LIDKFYKKKKKKLKRRVRPKIKLLTYHQYRMKVYKHGIFKAQAQRCAQKNNCGRIYERLFISRKWPGRNFAGVFNSGRKFINMEFLKRCAQKNNCGRIYRRLFISQKWSRRNFAEVFNSG
jgi:hypothetical protein